MAVTTDQQLAAYILKNRAHNKLAFDKELIISPEQMEFDTFYHYILSELALEMVSSKDPQKTIKVSIIQVPLCKPNDNCVILENDGKSSYSPHYVESSDFYGIIKEVSKAFNSGSLSNFHSKCSTKPKEAYIEVSLSDF